MNSLQKIRYNISQPIVILSMFMVFIWMVSDFSSRFMVNPKNEMNFSDNLELVKLQPIHISTSQKKQIMELYQGYLTGQQAQSVKQTEKGLTAEQQLQQQGKLKQLYAGDKKLELKAIITKNTNSRDNKTALLALILVSDIKTGESSIIHFANNSQVYGYTLTINNNTKATLTKKNEQGNQEIVLIMYER